MRFIGIGICLALSLSVAACGGGGNPDRPDGVPGEPDGSTDHPDSPPGWADAPPGTPDAHVSGAQPTIFTIVLENQDYEDIVGSSNAPYINSLIDQYGLATNYNETGSPSLPNYLNMISGDNQYFGLIDLDPTAFLVFPVSQPNLGTQLEAANVPWRSYQDSMGTPCALSGSGSYAPKHDPFLYFDDMQNGAGDLCANTNVDYAAHFQADLDAGTYRYMWITPDLNHDGHDPSTDPALGLRHADQWVSTEIPKILASDVYQAGGIIFLTWDEAEGRSGHDSSKIPMIIISPRLVSPGFRSNAAYTHSSYGATVEDLLDLPRLDKLASTPSMMEFFAP